jgi:peptidoglycan/xylan/chitin deacetylase (PgdA/CDA1 family)
MLDWKHVRKLRDAGITIGSHTVTHPILSFCSPERQKEELVLSKQVIETHLDEPCRYLAYPNGQKGDFDDVTRSLVRKIGYDAAFSFTGGAVKTGMDPTALPRQPIFEIPLNSFAVSLAWS